MKVLKASAILAAALGAAVLAWVFSTLPSRSHRLTPPSWPTPRSVVRGAFHVHTTGSDGTGSVDEVASAAARAGLAFVVLTDHGDGTRTPAPPAYHAGVLCIDGVEISTAQGHYAAIGMQPSPFPLGGEARDVVDDVARLGGLGIVTHPGSPRAELRWRDWEAPIDGLEWLNADSEWRDEPWPRLVRLLLDYPFRGPEAMASVFDRPSSVLADWDALTRNRRVVALAGADAHARFAVRGRRDPYDGTTLRGIPSYETSFRAFAMRVELSRSLSGVAADDAQTLLASVRAGHAYTAIDGLATPASFVFEARSGALRAAEGDEIDAQDPLDLQARVNGPPGTTIVLLANGRRVREVRGLELTFSTPPARAAYRIEVSVPGAPGTPPVLWLVSNPIYVGGTGQVRAARDAPASATSNVAVLDLGRLSDWHIEHDSRSQGGLGRQSTADRDEARISFRLGEGERAGQFVAVARPLGAQSTLTYDRVTFRIRAASPGRVSVQLRAPGKVEGRRWQRSIYVDETMRERTVFFADMRPAGETVSDAVPRGLIDSLLFVVDTTNTKPGTSGSLWLGDVRLER